MQNEVLSCGEARRRIPEYLRGEPCPSLLSHLARCEACLEACLETALATPAATKVPEGFQERVLGQLPVAASAEMRNCVWTLAAVAVSFAALALRLWYGGEIFVFAAAVIQRPAILAASAGIETVLALLWLWRALEAARSMSQ